MSTPWRVSILLVAVAALLLPGTPVCAQTDAVSLEAPGRSAEAKLRIGRKEPVRILARYNLVTTPSAVLVLRAGMDGTILVNKSYELEAGQGHRELSLSLEVSPLNRFFFVTAELLPDGAPTPLTDRLQWPCVLSEYLVQQIYDASLLKINSTPATVQFTAYYADGTPVAERAFEVATTPAPAPFGPDSLEKPGQTTCTVKTDATGTASFSYRPPTLSAQAAKPPVKFPMERVLLIKAENAQEAITVPLRISGVAPATVPGPAETSAVSASGNTPAVGPAEQLLSALPGAPGPQTHTTSAPQSASAASAAPAPQIAPHPAVRELAVMSSLEGNGNLAPQPRFEKNQGPVYIWFMYQNFPVPAVVNIHLYNGHVFLQEIPDILAAADGSKSVLIDSPATGWTPGTYRVSLSLNGRSMKTTTFTIMD